MADGNTTSPEKHLVWSYILGAIAFLIQAPFSLKLMTDPGASSALQSMRIIQAIPQETATLLLDCYFLSKIENIRVRPSPGQVQVASFNPVNQNPVWLNMRPPVAFPVAL